MTRFDLVTVAAVTAAVVLAGAASFVLVAGVALTPADPSYAADPWATPASSVGEGAADGAELVVDIEGGVISPGIHRLPAGSRVADALAAAGGYAEGADLAAAARSLNLAAAVVDGQQIYVPVLGEAPATGGAGAGLVNLNRAIQSELEALPGIGPVTAQKIMDARAKMPFATLDELVTREVLTARQLEQIADLVTVP
jgi:competence protein ComEA